MSQLQDKVVIVTGATGVLGGELAQAFAAEGARVGVLGRNTDRAEELVAQITDSGGQALSLIADVLDRAALTSARTEVLGRWGHIDVLVNAAGGHVAGAMTTQDRSFFALDDSDLRAVLDLNVMGTIIPSQVFGDAIAASGGDRGSGSIINFSSMSADRALSRVLGYGIAKAGVDNFTKWLASDLANLERPIRVNAIAPGFFVAETNRSLLVDSDGPTARGRQIIDRTPAGRFGAPAELVGTAVWLASEQSSFVTGVIVPVDGGFSAASGV